MTPNSRTARRRRGDRSRHKLARPKRRVRARRSPQSPQALHLAALGTGVVVGLAILLGFSGRDAGPEPSAQAGAPVRHASRPTPKPPATPTPEPTQPREASRRARFLARVGDETKAKSPQPREPRVKPDPAPAEGGVDPAEDAYDYDADDALAGQGPAPIGSPPERGAETGWGDAPPPPRPAADSEETPDVADLEPEPAPYPRPSSDDRALDTDSPVAEALREQLHVSHTLLRNRELSVSYPLRSVTELEDFDYRGFDKVEIGMLYGATGGKKAFGLELGAGSQRLGRLVHSIPFDSGDFEIRLAMWVTYSTSRSLVVFTLGQRYGVHLGQQIVKVTKSGKLRPLTRGLDRTAFRKERMVPIHITFRDGLLTVRCAGRKTAEKRLDVNALRGSFGILARDVRMQLTSLSLSGTLDVSAF